MLVFCFCNTILKKKFKVKSFSLYVLQLISCHIIKGIGKKKKNRLNSHLKIKLWHFFLLFWPQYYVLYFPAVFSGREGTELHSGVSSIYFFCLLSSFPFHWHFDYCFLIFYDYYVMLCYVVLIRVDKTIQKWKFYGAWGKEGHKIPVIGCVQLGWGALGANTLSADCMAILAGGFNSEYKNKQWNKGYVCLWQGMLRSSRHQILLWDFAEFIMP